MRSRSSDLAALQRPPWTYWRKTEQILAGPPLRFSAKPIFLRALRLVPISPSLPFLKPKKWRPVPPLILAAKEAELVFAPKSAGEAGGSADGRTAPQPRILPSLAPAENPIPERGVERLPQATSERRKRRKDASSVPPQPSAAKADRAEAIKSRTKRGAPVPAKEAAKRKLTAAPKPAFATPSATPAPPVSDISQTGESAARDKLRARRWAGAWRDRDNAAALPPGQQWKRRLNPRAW